MAVDLPHSPFGIRLQGSIGGEAANVVDAGRSMAFDLTLSMRRYPPFELQQRNNRC
jgi:hypothetical protein